ncbi:MAG: glycosyltransferase [Nitrospira sp.]|nr:glycosyltransferase [Nitrospira sp.]
MTRDQWEQRNQEEQFYSDLFVRSGTWSTPEPNTDEQMRWEKIKGFLPKIVENLNHAPGQPLRILDVGCGRGWLTNLLSDYGYCEGIDPVKTVVDYGQKLFPKLTFHSGFLDELFTRKEFRPYDLIVSSEVIEHIPHARKPEFVHALQQLLTPNGAVILTTPRREVWEQWSSVSTPNQPIEDWVTESDLLKLFRERGFYEIGMDRIYFDLPKFQYVSAPPKGGEPASSTIIALYQIWAFGNGIGFQGLFDYKGLDVESLPILQPLDGKKTFTSFQKPTPSPVNSEDMGITSQPRNPLVSVILPTFNRRDTLKMALESIIQQTFTDYEVIVVNDAGMNVDDIVTSFNARNNVTSIRHGRNRGLAAARNSGLGVARGKYIAYLDDDDRYACNHLETLVTFLERNPCQVAYSDAWRVSQRKEHDKYIEIQRDVPYSQDFNPDMLLITNCFPVLCVMHEKSCLNKSGVFDESLTTHEDWDLWIRLSRHYTFAHVKQITAEFTWRNDGSSMSSHLSKDFLRTRRLIYQKYDEYFRLQPHLIPIREQELRDLESRGKSQPFECSIIIPVFNKMDLTRQCLMHLVKVTTGISYEVVIVDNDSSDGTGEFLDTLGGDVQILRNSTNLGFAKACNQGARAARGKHLVFLNNDTIPRDGWLQALIEEVDTHSDVDVVGSKLLYPDNTIQHAGAVISRQHLTPYHLFQGVPESLPAANTRKELQAVTAACMLVRKETFEKAGGFDEGFVNGFEDIDFCLKVRQMGRKVVYQPKSCLYHLESQSPGRKQHDEPNAQRFVSHWEHKWLVDEDLVAYQNGYIIQQEFSEGQLRAQLTPKDQVADLAPWQRVVDLQQWLLGRECEVLAKTSDSQKIYNMLVDAEAWPNDIGILEWTGRVCSILQCEQEAVRFWTKLLTLGDHPNARLGLARAHLKWGNLDEAQKHLDVWKRTFIPRAEGWTLQGILSMQRQDYAQAKKAFGQSLAIDAADQKAHLGLGMACMGLGETAECFNIFGQVLLADPDNVEAMRGLIQAGTAMQSWEALAGSLTRFVERNPADCDMRFALAGVQLRAGQPDSAKRQFEMLSLLKPDLEGLNELEALLRTALVDRHAMAT